MSVLTENIVLSRTRAQDLNSVRKLNCWGSELTDVSLVRRMPYVEVLSLSVNSISTLLDFSFCKNLQELYIRKNCITDLNEVIYLKDLPRLKNLWLADNPCAECDHYRMTVLKALPNLQKLDNINVQPQEVEIAKTKGKTLVEPSEKTDENDDEQIIPVHTQTAHVKKEKIEEVVKPMTDKNQNQDMEDTRRNSQSPPHQIFETAVPKQTKAPTPPKPEPTNRDLEERETSVQNQQYINNQQLKQQQEATTVHRQMTTSVTEQRERVATNSVTNSSSSTSSSQHINHAFYARVQTLVDHSGRKPRKPSDLRCEGRSNKSATSSPPPPLPSNGIDESPDNFHLGDIEGQYYGSGGPGARDLSELETRSCSLDSEASYYLEQRAAVGSGGTASRMDKNSPTRILPKGGRNRNSNILSAVLCLIKELDFASLEVVETAIHCQMEDMEHPLYRP